MKRSVGSIFGMGFFLFLVYTAIALTPEPISPLLLVSGFNSEEEMTGAMIRYTVYWRGSDFLIGTSLDALQKQAGESKFSVIVLEDIPSEMPLYLVTSAPGGETRGVFEPWVSGENIRLLYADNEKAILRAGDMGLESILLAGFEAVRIREVPLPGIPEPSHRSSEKPGGDPLHDPIQALVGQVSETNLESNIQNLQDFRSRYVQSDSIWAAGQWIFDQFVSYGYSDVRFDTLDVTVFGEHHRNVLATKQGVGDPSRFVIIGSHYDSFAFPNPNTNAPGADDNGSGVSAVLEIARILADEPMEASIIFAAWTAEEVGLVGSGDFVDRANQAGMNIELYMNLDACGYLGDPLKDVDLLADGPSTPYSELMLSMAERYTTLAPSIVPNIDFSDHASFRQYGYPFTYSLEGEITPFIHTPQDLVSTIDFPYMKEIVQMNLATLAEVAGLSQHRLYLALDPQQQNLTPGDTLRFDTRLANTTGVVQSGDLWFEMVTSDSMEVLIPDQFLSLSSNPVAGSIADGQEIMFEISLYIPQNISPGNYQLVGRIGSYGGPVVDEDSFPVVVSFNGIESFGIR